MIAGTLLDYQIRAEQLRPFCQDENRGAQLAMLLEHIDQTVSPLVQAMEGEAPDLELLGTGEFGAHLAGLAYDLMRTDIEASARHIGTLRSQVNEGLAWVWKGMRGLKEDSHWPIRYPEDAQDVLAEAEKRREHAQPLHDGEWWTAKIPRPSHTSRESKANGSSSSSRDLRRRGTKQETW